MPLQFGEVKNRLTSVRGPTLKALPRFGGQQEVWKKREDDHRKYLEENQRKHRFTVVNRRLKGTNLTGRQCATRTYGLTHPKKYQTPVPISKLTQTKMKRLKTGKRGKSARYTDRIA